MKAFRWSQAKDEKLRKERGISFEEMLESIAEGGLLETLEHPNKAKYAGQRMFVVRHRSYVYLVPFIETEKDFFLKTIIPSRKFLKKYREDL